MEEKRNLRKAYLLIAATLGIIILGAVVAIPVLTRTAIFMGSMNANNGIVDKTDAIPPGSPQITLSYDATNSAVQTISGLSEPGSNVYLSQNSKVVGNVLTDNSGIFQFPHITLDQGENLFSAVAMDQSGNKSLTSTQVRLVYSSNPPKLDITSPTDRQVITDKNSVELKGTTENASRLTVNDHNVILGSKGQFDTNINLNSGDNVLVFVASDVSGNSTRKEMTVTYNQ